MPVAVPQSRGKAVSFLNRSPRLRATRALKGWISEGVLPRGERLPSAFDLSARLKIPRSTVNLALRELAQEGWISGAGRHRTVLGAANGASRVMDHTLVVLSDLSPDTVTGHHAAGWQEFIQLGVLRAAREAGMHSLVMQAALAPEGRAHPLAGDRPRGVVALRGAVDSERGRALLRTLMDRGLPVVAYGDAGEVPAFDTVCSDHEAGSYELTRWLIRRGCRRILRYWLLQPALPRRPGWLVSRDRGHERAIREAGLPLLPALEARELLLATGSREDFDALAKYSVGQLSPHLAGRQPVDAILCVSDGAVTHVAAACRLLGKRPNADVALVGYDNYWMEVPGRQWEPTPPLATVDKRNLQIGQALVELLRDRLAGKLPPEPQHRLVPPDLVPCETKADSP